MGKNKGYPNDDNDCNDDFVIIPRAIELISALIFLSHSIRVFTGKWQSIRTKLEELNSCLSAAENCDSSSCEDLGLSNAVRQVLETVLECEDLSQRCLQVSYSGKLLMQSDLDVILTKLNYHVKKLCAIVGSGSLTFRQAIVVSRPGLDASKEDMRFYVRDLLTRLKIGDQEMKKQALLVLNELVVENDKYVKTIVEIDGFVNVLVNFMCASEVQIQDGSAKIIAFIAGFDCYKSVLIGAGVIAPLIRCLECGSEVGKEWLATCLMRLTVNSDNAWTVSANGGVTALLRICGSGDCKGELISLACGILKNLSGVEEIKRFMIDQGLIPMLLKLVRSRDEAPQMSSIELLQALASGDESTRQMIIRGGGVCALVRVLDPKFSFSFKSREVTLQAIDNLCYSSSSTIAVLLNNGFLDQLHYFLRNGDVSVQELTLKAVYRLSGKSEEAKKAMGDAGYMGELIRFLSAKSYEVREMAAEALHSMILVPRNRRRFVQDDRSIGLILQVLDPEEGNSGNRKLLLSTLMEITSCNSGRRRIINSGYLRNIEKLAETEDSDAKKIVRKLSTNRFRSMLTGIWHS